MLTVAEFCLAAADGRRLPAAAGSLLHGVLMELIGSETAAALHNPGLRPYSQHLYHDNRGMVWRIAALNRPAADALIKPLLADNMTHIYLRDKQLTLTITARQLVHELTYRELADRFFLADAPLRRLSLCFVTPTSFRSDNNYMIYPTVPHIIQSLYNRWDCFADKFSLNDPEALGHMASHLHITGYRLHMAPFSLEGVRVPAFKGDLTLSIAGPNELARLAGLLLAYGEFAGIGIKTALGMGGVRVFTKPRPPEEPLGILQAVGHDQTGGA